MRKLIILITAVSLLAGCAEGLHNLNKEAVGTPKATYRDLILLDIL